ncbi:MAG: selenide, water dikinase SelD, partial [Chloroflexi bacterium]|nr:selenide, water dikinase SelD [Chloroflexota bacterium]
NLELAILTEIMRGGADKVKEAGAVIAGGHTVTDQEPKYGLAVTGLIHPDRMFTKGGTRLGDAIVLTKPLGTGTITTALKRRQADEADVAKCVESMSRLNRDAARVASGVGVKGATDITGFGLLGHAHEVAHLSGVALRLRWESLPWLPGALKYGEQWIFPGGAERNEKYFGQWVTFADSLADWQRMLLFDPQTSGGLFIAVPSLDLQRLLDAMESSGQACWVIGEAVSGDAGRVEVI